MGGVAESDEREWRQVRPTSLTGTRCKIDEAQGSTEIMCGRPAGPRAGQFNDKIPVVHELDPERSSDYLY